jgi:hypothetical protein
MTAQSDKLVVESFSSNKVFSSAKQIAEAYNSKTLDAIKADFLKFVSGDGAVPTGERVYFEYLCTRVASICRVAMLFTEKHEDLLVLAKKAESLRERKAKSEKIAVMEGFIWQVMTKNLSAEDLEKIKVEIASKMSEKHKEAVLINLKFEIFKQFLCDWKLATAFGVKDQLFRDLKVWDITSEGYAANIAKTVTALHSKKLSATQTSMLREVACTPLLTCFFAKPLPRGNESALKLFFSVFRREFLIQRMEFIDRKSKTPVALEHFHFARTLVPTMFITGKGVIEIDGVTEYCSLTEQKKGLAIRAVTGTQYETSLTDFGYVTRHFGEIAPTKTSDSAPTVPEPPPMPAPSTVAPVVAEKPADVESEVKEKAAEMEPKQKEEEVVATVTVVEEKKKKAREAKVYNEDSINKAAELYAAACNVAVRFFPFVLAKSMRPMTKEETGGAEVITIGKGESGKTMLAIYSQLDEMIECKFDESASAYRLPAEKIEEIFSEEKLPKMDAAEAMDYIRSKMSEAYDMVVVAAKRWKSYCEIVSDYVPETPAASTVAALVDSDSEGITRKRIAKDESLRLKIIEALQILTTC